MARAAQSPARSAARAEPATAPTTVPLDDRGASASATPAVEAAEDGLPLGVSSCTEKPRFSAICRAQRSRAAGSFHTSAACALTPTPVPLRPPRAARAPPSPR